ncbi:MAG: hypothetical protein HC816_18315 [Leptolyngbyaceae cyanobacterium RM1_1_2]|nr:hypothetical protein [Leptolyngbyaceae cyanobacterium RM1_1_2]
MVLPKLSEPADLQVLKLDAFEAEARTDWQEARHLWRRILAVRPDSQAFEALERVALRSRPITETPREPGLPISGTRSIAPESNQPEPVSISPSTQTPKLEMPPKPLVPTFEFVVVTVNDQGKIIDRQKRQAEYHREDLGKGISLDLVQIPGDSFLMGSPDDEAERFDTEGPQHSVSVSPFLMGNIR